MNNERKYPMLSDVHFASLRYCDADYDIETRQFMPATKEYVRLPAMQMDDIYRVEVVITIDFEGVRYNDLRCYVFVPTLSAHPQSLYALLPAKIQDFLNEQRWYPVELGNASIVNHTDEVILVTDE